MLSMPTPEASNYHFAIGGKSWGALRQYFPDVIPKVTAANVKYLSLVLIRILKDPN